MYNPDEWVIIKINGTDPHYRLFGSWSGSWCAAEEWRMNSGIVSVNETDTHYVFNGYSGSSYKCPKNSYGIRNAFNSSICNSFVKSGEGTVELLEEMPDIMNIDWII